MFVRTTIAWVIATVLLSCSKKPAIDYLALNHDKTDHTDGMTPNRLGNLKGHIRSITQYVYPLTVAADGSLQRGKLMSGTPTYTLQFSEEGFITEDWGYHAEDVVAHKTFFRSHRLYQVDSVIYWTEAGKMWSREVYTYDKDGIPVGGFEEHDGQREDKVQHIGKSGDTLVVTESQVKDYYLNGHKVKTEIVGHGAPRLYRYSYFPSGALRQEISYENGIVDQDERYDGLGNLMYWLSARIENGQVTSSRETTLTYQKNLCIQEISKHVDGPDAWTDTMRYEYQGGRRVWSSRNGQPSGTYEYNEHNDELRTKNDFMNEGYRYISYDADGNWTERIMLNGDEPFHVEVRKIEYY